MDEKSDAYIGLTIKNWAAHYQPPRDGREQLLHRAKIIILMSEMALASIVFPSNERFCKYHQQYLVDEWTKGSQVLVRLWSMGAFSLLRIFA
ncbi:MAG: hypothetical protein JXA78_02630 [Anaerolineales bacterium]|nr:hypothetical protein [Anaerolineales bacterium]